MLVVYIALGEAGGAVAKCSKSRVSDKVPEGSVLIFRDTIAKHSVGQVEGNLCKKYQLDQCCHFHRPIQYWRVTDTCTAPLETMDRLSLSSLSELVREPSNSG